MKKSKRCKYVRPAKNVKYVPSCYGWGVDGDQMLGDYFQFCGKKIKRITCEILFNEVYIDIMDEDY